VGDAMDLVTSPGGKVFSVTFYRGLPPASIRPCLFLLDDGSMHAGDLVPGVEPGSQLLRTTNPTVGLHEKLDIPVRRVQGYAFAGKQFPFSNELAG
jgi:hypothetical protein